MMKIIYLGVGSLMGGFARYFLTGAIHRGVGSAFPYGTLAVNLAGCFLIGFLSALADEKFFLGSEGRLLLMTGFCGAFTTFSTFMLENGNLVKGGDPIRALINVGMSLIGGYIVFKFGIFFAKFFNIAS